MRDDTGSTDGSTPVGPRSTADDRRYSSLRDPLRTTWRRLCAAGLAALIGAGSPPALAAEAAVSPAVAAEVDALLQTLARSGCRFQRNGRWYGADEARAHLVMKWQELQKRRLAQSTERFIELAASESMLSGRPYEVQCGTSVAKPSAVWLRQQLQALRAGPPRAP